MSPDRRDLLLKEPLPERPKVINEAKLLEDVDKAAAFQAMCETRGFKKLLEEFIKPRSSIDRLLQRLGPNRHAEERGAVRELVLLMNYIDGKITDGQKANSELEVLRKNKGRK